MTTFHTAYLRRMFAKKQARNDTFQEIRVIDDETARIAREKFDDDKTLCGADRKREALYGFVLLAVFLAAVFAAAARIF